MSSHRTFCGQLKPISISKVLSIHKITGYCKWEIHSHTIHAPVPFHSAVTVSSGLTGSFIVTSLFFEEMDPACPFTVTTSGKHYENLFQTKLFQHFNSVHV